MVEQPGMYQVLGLISNNKDQIIIIMCIRKHYMFIYLFLNLKKYRNTFKLQEIPPVFFVYVQIIWRNSLRRLIT
jgi:hypothetical protein